MTPKRLIYFQSNYNNNKCVTTLKYNSKYIHAVYAFCIELLVYKYMGKCVNYLEILINCFDIYVSFTIYPLKYYALAWLLLESYKM